MDWDLLRYFVVTQETGSLLGASIRLGVSQPTVGRKISELEEHLGCKLFLRSTRGLVLTRDGERLHDQADRLRAEVSAMCRDANNTGAGGVVRLSTSEGLGRNWVTGFLAEFGRFHPDVKVELIVTNRSVDLMRNESDIALRLGNPGVDRLFGRRIAKVQFGLYASREYLAANALPQTTADLRDHAFVGLCGDLAKFEPSIWFASKHRETIPAISTNSLLTSLAATEQGMGIGLAACIVASKIEGLVRVLPELDAPAMPLWLVSHPDTRKLPKIKALVAFIADQARRDFADGHRTSPLIPLPKPI